MNLQDLINDPPQLHESRSGELTVWKLCDEALYFIDRHITSESKTLETGAGLSTLLFALKQSSHTCIAPDAKGFERIKTYAQQHNISTEKISFRASKSEDVLPGLEEKDLDLVLIDGSHAFPSPFIDWYYASRRLKVGGILIVDDTQIWTGAVLKNFLLSESEWQLQEDFSSRSAAFIKQKEYAHSKTWRQQPFVARQSQYPILVAKFRRAIELFQRGKFGKLASKLTIHL
jgi:hypothetical protein